jgi:probable HAF family extracellular repeat protein
VHVAGISFATAVSPGGQVVGYDTGATVSATHAFSWTKHDGMIDLGTPPGTDDSFAIGVTPSGGVAGYGDHYESLTGQTIVRAFWWTKQNGMVAVGPSTGTETRPYAVSTTGQVVGVTDATADHHRHAFAWTERGGLIDLGTFGGFLSIAYAANARGEIVGTSALPPTPNPGGGFRVETHAVVWEPASS